MKKKLLLAAVLIFTLETMFGIFLINGYATNHIDTNSQEFKEIALRIASYELEYDTKFAYEISFEIDEYKDEAYPVMSERMNYYINDGILDVVAEANYINHEKKTHGGN